MSSISIGGLLRRPEAGAALGLVAVLIFFAIFGGLTFLKPAGMASWLNVAANLGVIAIPLGLLMIAGELDISVGAMVPFGAMTVAVISGHYGLSIWLGVAVALSLRGDRRAGERLSGDQDRRAVADRHAGQPVCRAGHRAGPDGPDHQIHLGRPDHRRPRQGDLRRLRPGRPVAGDGALVAGADRALHLLRPLLARSGTGSSPWAATRFPPATPASRPTG